jgi:hypothetical protein
VSALYRHEVDFLRLLVPFCAFGRTFTVLGQAEFFRCKKKIKIKIFFTYPINRLFDLGQNFLKIA